MPVSFYDKKGNRQTVPDEYDESGRNIAQAGLRAKGYKTGQLLVGNERSKRPGVEAFIPDEELSDALGTGKFDTPEEWSAKRSKTGISAGESAARGLAQGLTFEGADELQAAVRAPFSDRTYAELRDEYRAGDRAAEEEQFGAFLGGNLAGGFAGGAGGAAKAGLKGLAKAGALQGAAGGFGAAEGDALSQVGSTIAGAGIGALAPVGMRGLEKLGGAAVQAGKGAAKEAIGMASDLGRDAIDFYLAHSKRVNAARPLEDLAREVQGGLDAAARDVSRKSGESYELLERAGTAIDKGSIVEAIRQRAAALEKAGLYTPGAQKDHEQLLRLAESVAAAPGEAVQGAQLKNLLSQLGDMGDYENVRSGTITPTLQRTIQGLRGEVDDATKFLNEPFREKMAETARGAQLLENVKPRFDTPEKAYNSLKGISRERSPFQKENLEALDEYLGKDLAFEARASGIKDAFDARTTNGSRNVNLGGRIGEAAGGFGNAIGAAIGYAKDTLARPAAKATLDFAIRVEPLIAGAGRYAAPLAEAAKKSPAAFMLTHNLLMQSQPEYRALVEGE